MKLKVKSYYDILIGEYPFHKHLKEEIVPLLEKYPDIQQRKTNVKATMTEWKWNPGSERIERLKQCIITEIYNHFQYNYINEPQLAVIFKDFWANVYRKGDYTKSHNHMGSMYSFAYFLKATWYDSPFVFTDSKKRIRPKEGRYIIFPSHLTHHVPTSRFNGTRITFSGNLERVD